MRYSIWRRYLRLHLRFSPCLVCTQNSPRKICGIILVYTPENPSTHSNRCRYLRLHLRFSPCLVFTQNSPRKRRATDFFCIIAPTVFILQDSTNILDNHELFSKNNKKRMLNTKWQRTSVHFFHINTTLIRHLILHFRHTVIKESSHASKNKY